MFEIHPCVFLLPPWEEQANQEEEKGEKQEQLARDEKDETIVANDDQ